MSKISLAKIEKSNFKKAIKDSLNLLEFPLDQAIRKVVIKPNMCYYWDCSTGQTTDPGFVAALIDVLREKTSASDIAIIESDASAMKCKYAFRFLGYEKLFKDSGVRLVNLSEEEGESVKVQCNGQSHEFVVPKIIRTADLRINLPKIKYARKGVELTCALKNVFGCNPYPQKFKYHPQLGDVIVALNKLMKFDLCIIDGTIVLGMHPRKLDLVMTSQDPVAIDAAAARIAGLNPRKVPYLKLASQEGLGLLDFIVKGEPIDQFRDLYPRMTLEKKLKAYAYSWVVRLKLAKRLGIG